MKVTYNESFLYFFVDQSLLELGVLGQKQQAPPVLQFPIDPQIFQQRELQQRWKLSEHQAELYTCDSNMKNYTLRAFRKGIGDGSIGLYTEYTINKNTGIPTLRRSVVRTLEDHQFGFNCHKEKLPHGKGWILYKAKKPIDGKLEERFFSRGFF